MWEFDCLQNFQVSATAMSEAGCVPLSHSVDSENRCFSETRIIEGARGVSFVMSDVLDWSIEAQHFPDLAFRPVRVEPRQDLFLRRQTGQHHPDLARQFLRRLLVVSNAIDFVDRQSTFFKAIVECALGNA